jgi:class 3 adenylate cyclase/tetratricopeptide (TPR) repeat protein
MKCPRCTEENAPGTKFCGACGTRLVAVCAACNAQNPAGQKFCGECGAALGSPRDHARFGSAQSYTPRHLAEKILTSRSALEGERKQVTVLFADMKGSLELLLDRDPEEARMLLDPVLERMMEAVHRYEGTVNQVMGDGIMAIFGAPLSHEDHAVRACYAALRMQGTIAEFSTDMRRTEGVVIQIRIGINSGEVVVRSIGNDLHMDYTAVGQTTHLAARIEQLATPGSILITADSLRLAEGYLQTKPLGPVAVKGLPAPVDVHEVIAAAPVRSRLQAAAARGLTPFVGRRREMEMLHEALHLAAADKGQVLAVVGEAGVGKSRLLHEFIHSPQTRSWLVVESSSISYGHATPYLPLIEFLKSYFKVAERDDPRTIREKVTGKVVLLDQSLQDSMPPVLDLLGALPEDHPFRSLEPPQRQQQTARAITHLLLVESRRQPVIAVFEDLHWNDTLTLSLLRAVVSSIHDSRVLLLVSYRPEHHDEWKEQPHYRQIQLNPLGQEGVEQLLQVLLGADPQLGPLKKVLVAHTGGNPFFVEEIVRTLVETEVFAGARGRYRLAKPFSSLQVPATVHAVLSARIDRLSAEQKRLLQEAAVLGQDVPFALLQAIAAVSEQELRARLAELQAAEYLYESRLFPDLEYTFKHALTHEVAYSGLLHERRRDIHARIVEAIETLYAGRLGEQVERLADHARRGELWAKALPYLRKAGTKAVERPANREALALFEQALEVLTHLPESRETLEQAVDLRFDIRNALQPLGDLARITEYLREAEVLATRLDDHSRLGWVASYLAEHYRMLGNTDAAAAAGERALAIARRRDDFALQVVTNMPLGLLYHALGDYRRAMELFQWNVAHLRGGLERERFGLFGLPAVHSRAFLAWCHAELGNFAEGADIAEEGVRIGDAADHPFSRVYAYLGTGVVYLRKGDLTRAISAFERALAIAETTNIPVGFAYGASYLGYALALSGNWVEGVALLEQTADQAIKMSFVARHSLRLTYLGEAYLLAGRPADAAVAGANALELACTYKERAHEAYALRLHAELAEHHGAATGAEAHYRSALTIARELGMRPLQAHCRAGLARVLQATGQAEPAAAEREAAARLFRSMEMRVWERPLKTEHAPLK